MKYLVVFVVFAVGACNGGDPQPKVKDTPSIDVNGITHPSVAPVTQINEPTSNATTVNPNSTVPVITTPKPPAPSPEPTPNTNVTTPSSNVTTPAPKSTTPAPITTVGPTPKSTTLAPVTTALPNNVTSVPPPTKKPDPLPVTTVAPAHNRKFDGPSFVGGIVLALGMVAIAFVAFKFYKARTELNYHTL